MQTYTTLNKELDLKKLINEQKNEPIILKNNLGNNFLVLPFSENKKNDIFLMLYKTYEDLEEITFKIPQNQKKHKMTAKEFTTKWLGFMKDTEVSEDYKEEYYEFLNKKYQ